MLTDGAKSWLRQAGSWSRSGLRQAIRRDSRPRPLRAITARPARAEASLVQSARAHLRAQDDGLVALPLNPIPNGAVVGLFSGFDGLPLRFARWAATRGPRRGTVVIFPGRSEFIEKYLETVGDLRRRGFAVAVMDWRGQGGSARELDDPRKGHVADFADYDRDLRCFMREVVLPDCPPPYIALAHSLGANILLRNAVATDSWFDRTVLIAPMIKLHPERVRYPDRLVGAYVRMATRVGQATRYIPGGGADALEDMAFEHNPLTGDRDRFERNRMLMRSAPHLLLGDPTIGWLAAAYASMREMQKPAFAERIQVPLMVFNAGDDRIVDPRATEELVNRTKLGLHIRFEGARHEILQERDTIRARFFAAFDAYLGVSS